MSQAQIRSVTVRFDADIAAYLAKTALIRKATDDAIGDPRLLSTRNRQLTNMSTRLDKVAVSAEKAGRATTTLDRGLTTTGNRVVTTSRQFDQGSKSIDKFSGRLGVMLDLVLGLGPALIPIAAEAVPLTAALAANLTFVAAGGGTAILALRGVGDALKAMNQYGIDPSDANLEALQEKLVVLSPAARDLVVELHRLTPEFRSLQGAAAAGFLPGLADGIHSAADDLPLVRRILGGIGDELGDLSSDAGDALSSDQWRPFLRFIGREAPGALDDMGRSIGHVIHGLAELIMAFDPLTDDVNGGLLRMSRDFDRWAASVGRTKDFQAFLDYLRENGPRVIELLGQTGKTMIDIATAVAPLGGPTIGILTNLLEVISAIADSDLGTPIFGALVALRLFSRGAQLAGVQVEGSFLGMARAPRAVGARLTELRAETSLWARQTVADARLVTESYLTAGAASERMVTRTAGASSRLKSTGGKLAAGAGIAGGLALVGSGASDEIGLTNTAMLAMAGSVIPGWGTAVGGAIGLGLDWKASLDADKESMDAFGASIDELAAGGNVAKLQSISDQLHAAGDQGGLVGDVISDMGDRVDKGLAKAEDKVGDLTHKQYQAAAAAGKFGKAEQEAAQHTLAMRNAARETSKQFLTLGDDVDNTKVSLEKWVRQMAREAEDLRNFGNNARRAADKGLRDGLIKQLEELGPAGALRMRQLANASQSEIGRANKAFDAGKRATNNLADAYSYISNHPPVLSVKGVPQSVHELRLVEEALRRIHDKVVHVTTVRAAGGRSLPGLADGGTIPGPRSPYGDSVLLLGAPGEEIIGNRNGGADAYRRDRAAGRIPAYADGGTVGRWGTPATPSPQSGSGGALGPLSVSGTLDTPWGPATIHGIARDVAREVYQTERAADDRFEEARS